MATLEGQVRDGTEAAETVGDTGPIGLDTDMSQRVRIAGPATGATNARATGTLTTAAGAGSTVQIATGGCSVVTADVTANTNVTIVIEGQFANGSWAAINGFHPSTSAVITGFAGTNGQCSIPCGGMTAVRLRCSAVGATPTATVKLEAGPGDAGKATEATLGALNAKVTACDTSGAATSALQGPWTAVPSTALEAGHVITGAASSVRGLDGRIDSTAATATYYVQIVAPKAGPALPDDGAVPFIAPLRIDHTNGVNSQFSLPIPDGGVNAASGWCWCVSSTEFAKTIVGAVASCTGYRS